MKVLELNLDISNLATLSSRKRNKEDLNTNKRGQDRAYTKLKKKETDNGEKREIFNE